MSNVVKIEQEQATAVQSEVGAVVSMIERAARDPAVDIDKMERLMQMRERILDRDAQIAFSSAMAEMSPELPAIIERGKIDIGHGKPQSYALWEDINEQIKPVLSKYGFSLGFRTGRTDTHIVVTGILRHRSGHIEETTLHLPLDTSGSKNAVQAVGSSTSYGKRYTAAALLNLTSRGEDDDGKAAGRKLTIDVEQAQTIRDALTASKSSEAKFLKWAKVERIEDIAADVYDSCLDAICNAAKARNQS